MLLVNETLKEITLFTKSFQNREHAGRRAEGCSGQNPAGRLAGRRARIVECVFSAPLIDTTIALLLELRGENIWHRMFFFFSPANGI